MTAGRRFRWRPDAPAARCRLRPPTAARPGATPAALRGPPRPASPRGRPMRRSGPPPQPAGARPGARRPPRGGSGAGWCAPGRRPVRRREASIEERRSGPTARPLGPTGEHPDGMRARGRAPGRCGESPVAPWPVAQRRRSVRAGRGRAHRPPPLPDRAPRGRCRGPPLPASRDRRHAAGGPRSPPCRRGRPRAQDAPGRCRDRPPLRPCLPTRLSPPAAPLPLRQAWRTSEK